MNFSLTIRLVLASSALLLHAQAADDAKAVKLKFTGSPSCASTSCHGGGTGRNECVIYERKDRHFASYGKIGRAHV